MATRQLPPGIDAETILETIRLGRENSAILDASWRDLFASHPDEWVLVDAGRFAFGSTLEGAIAAARAAGFDMSVAAIDHLRRERPVTLL